MLMNQDGALWRALALRVPRVDVE